MALGLLISLSLGLSPQPSVLFSNFHSITGFGVDKAVGIENSVTGKGFSVAVLVIPPGTLNFSNVSQMIMARVISRKPIIPKSFKFLIRGLVCVDFASSASFLFDVICTFCVS